MGSPEEMHDLRNNHLQGVCSSRFGFSVPSHACEKYYHHAEKYYHLLFTLMFSRLGQTVFLKLHSILCMLVSLESVTEPSCSAGPEQTVCWASPRVSMQPQAGNIDAHLL